MEAVHKIVRSVYTFWLFCMAICLLNACGEHPKGKVLVGKWKLSFEPILQTHLQNMDSKDKAYYAKIPATSKEKRLTNMKKNIENIYFQFKEDKQFTLSNGESLEETGKWELKGKEKETKLVLKNEEEDRRDVFQVDEITKDKIVLIVSEKGEKLVLKSIK